MGHKDFDEMIEYAIDTGKQLLFAINPFEKCECGKRRLIVILDREFSGELCIDDCFSYNYGTGLINYDDEEKKYFSKIEKFCEEVLKD